VIVQNWHVKTCSIDGRKQLLANQHEDIHELPLVDICLKPPAVPQLVSRPPLIYQLSLLALG